MVLVLGLVPVCGEGHVWDFMVVAFALRVVFRWCPLCYRNLEITQHLFSECAESKRIWAEVSSFVGSPGLDPTNWNATATLMDWFHGMAGDSGSTMAAGSRSLAILVTWFIWKEQSARVFNNTEKTVARLVEEIKDEARLWCQAGAKHLAALVVNPSSE